MTHASLFSGIGGFDLAAEWAGWTNLFNCEIDNFCQKILKYHFHDATQYKDIRTVDFSVWHGRVDVLSGGFPCQPFSLAGKRQGTADDRYLWPEMLRAIRAIRPRWVVGENVYGLVNWSRGMVFEQVCSDLEDEGYAVQAYILPACAVDAPHRRDRVWIVAHADRNRCGKWTSEQKSIAKCERASVAGNEEQARTTADTAGYGLQPWNTIGAPAIGREIIWFDRFPTQSPICRRDDGISAELDGITFPRWRRESIKAYGNSVVPQLVYEIFETINDYEQSTTRPVGR